jgi:hypothetical protein
VYGCNYSSPHKRTSSGDSYGFDSKDIGICLIPPSRDWTAETREETAFDWVTVRAGDIRMRRRAVGRIRRILLGGRLGVDWASWRE